MRLPSYNQAFQWILLFLMLPPPSYQVNIKLSYSAGTPVQLSPQPSPSYLYEQICNDIEPGRCCKAATIQNPSFNPQLLRVAAVSGLLPLDIATVWKPQDGRSGCEGVAVGVRSGPGTYYYPDRDQASSLFAYPDARQSETEPEPGYIYPYISGASYMRIPGGKPDYTAEAPWLEAQGIIGLAWGDGQWFSDQATSNLVASMRAQMGLGGSKFLRMKRGIMSPLKGKVFAQPPAVPVWPNEVIINGTSYTQRRAGSLTYVSETGDTVMLDSGN